MLTFYPSHFESHHEENVMSIYFQTFENNKLIKTLFLPSQIHAVDISFLLNRQSNISMTADSWRQVKFTTFR